MDKQIMPLHSHTWLCELCRFDENNKLQVIDYCKNTTYNGAEMMLRIYNVRILNEPELAGAFAIVKPLEMKRYVIR